MENSNGPPWPGCSSLNRHSFLWTNPFQRLTQQTRRNARLLLKEAIRDRATTVIHITHDLDDTWALANKLAVFKDGLLIQQGAVHDVFNRPKNRFIAEFVGTGFYHGTVVDGKNGRSNVDVGGTVLQSLDKADNGDEVDVAIRHEDIRVTRDNPALVNGFNVVNATLKNIVPEGSSSLLDLRIDNNIAMHALLTHHTMEELDLRRGDHLYALIRKRARKNSST